MSETDPRGVCHFVHTYKSGGPVGRECGRPEADHCREGYGCVMGHLLVHHPFHVRPVRRGCKAHGGYRARCPKCKAAEKENTEWLKS